MTEIGFFSFIAENHGHFVATMEPAQPEQHQRGFVENNCQPKHKNDVCNVKLYKIFVV